MALSAKTNQLAGPGVTGNSATTDPGFQPKGLLIWNGLQTATGAVADAQFSLGFASSTTTETAAGYNSDDALASSDVVRMFNTARVMVNLTSGTTTTNLVTDLASFDATGFTLNWATLGTANPLFNYLALGGDDITNVASGNFSANTATGNQSVTGLGFQPDIVLLITQISTTSSQANSNSVYTMGAATSSSAQWSCGVTMQNGLATMNTQRSFYTDHCLEIIEAGSSAVNGSATFVSRDAGGFTINWDDAPSAAWLVGYIAIKGGQWNVGTETQKTSTGTKATTGMGFTPSGVIFASHCDTTVGSVVNSARHTFGVTTGPSNNTAVWTGDRDNVPDSIANTIMRANKCIVMATEGTSATPTVDAEAALSSLDSDGFTLDWTTADATARRFGYIAFGSNASGGTTATPDVGNLVTTSFAPTIQLPKLVTPEVQSIGLTTYAPSIGLSIIPPIGTLTTATFAPTVLLPQSVIPSTVTLQISTFSPTISTSDEQVVTPSPAALSLSALTPVAVIGVHIYPNSTALLLTGLTPQVNLTIVPTAAGLALSLLSPTVVVSDNISVTPETVSASLTGFAPSVNSLVSVTPNTASLMVALFAPSTSVTLAKAIQYALSGTKPATQSVSGMKADSALSGQRQSVSLTGARTDHDLTGTKPAQGSV